MEVLLTEIRGNVAWLTMNRPQVHNALSPELMVRLARAWHQLLADDRVRVVILTGAGDQAFCTGADLGRLIPLLSGARAAGRRMGPRDNWPPRSD